MTYPAHLFFRTAFCLLLGAGLLAACAPPISDDTPTDEVEVGTLVQSEVERADPQVSDAALQTVAEGYNAFAFDFYQQLRQTETGNLIFSPYSISSAFAMVYAGAQGNTESEMAQGFHYTLPQDELHVALNRLAQDLSTPDSEDDSAFQLNLANAVWAQRNYTINPPYLDLLAAQYGVGVHIEDFTSEGGRGSAVENINAWADDATEGKISQVVTEDNFNDMTRLVLANAIYFKGDWRYPFEADATFPRPFTTLEGATNNVPMMGQSLFTDYAEGDGWQAIALPYEGERVRMVAIRPADDTFSDYEAALTAEDFAAITAALENLEVVVVLPKFEYETTLPALPDLLMPLGMQELFTSGAADLRGIEPTGQLFVGSAIHKATITVDEEGTEAAAVTVISGEAGSAPPGDEPEPKFITFDRPFIYVIQDQTTGAILFVGRVVELGG